jgi:acyl-CoA thioester hydrolase
MSDHPDTAQTSRPLLARIPISVRWRDMDAFGHVNNAMYVSYLEEARVRWLHGITDMSKMGSAVAPVVAKAEVNYRLPIVWPNDIVVELFIERLGNSSMAIGHRIVADNDQAILYADGHVVLVWIDPATGRSAPLPEAVRMASTVA